MSLEMKYFVILSLVVYFAPITVNSFMPRRSLNIAAKKGFTVRLVHRSSPHSPFYDPHKTVDEIIAENHQISDERQLIMNITSNVDFRRKPASLDFALVYGIGTPGFETVGVPDTGSSLIWLQCSTCIACYDQDIPMFNLDDSSTYAPITCDDHVCEMNERFSCSTDTEFCSFGVHYQKGPSALGAVAKDTFTLFDKQSVMRIPNVIFGCGIYNLDNYGSRLPGVVGLGNDSFSLVNQLQGPKIFSFCQSEDPNDGTFIRFGKEAELLGLNTSLETNTKKHYHLTLDGIDVKNKPVDIWRSYFYLRKELDYETGVVLDTGSTYSYLIPEAFDALVKTVSSFMNNQPVITKNWDLCYGKRLHRYEELPELTFLFRNSPMKLSYRSAWIIDGTGNYCLAFKRGTFRYSVFGMYQQRGYNIGFQLEANKLWISPVKVCHV